MSNEKNTTVLDIKAIREILPHRYPFLLVDRIIDLDLEKGTIIGQKNVTINEEFFQGHFPAIPIMPGVLILEALAQTSGVLLHRKGCQGRTVVLLNVNNAKFRKPVKPGDVLYLHARGIHFGIHGGKVHSQAFVNDQIVAEAEIGLALVKSDQV